MRHPLSFEDFCRFEYEAVYRACFAFSGSRELALDATQEAFGRAFARWRRLRKEQWAGGWVMTTALNLVRRGMRRRPTTDVSDSIVMDDPDLRVDILEALRSLPLRQRQAVILYYLADLPVAAVAELMNASEGSVKTHLSRARRRLRKTLVLHETGGQA